MKHTGITLPVIGFLIASGLSYAAGEFFSKKFAEHPSVWTVVVVMAMFALEGALWLPAIAQTNQLVVTSTIWSLIAFISTIIIGVVIFHETLSPLAWWGLGFGALSILCLSLG